VELTTSGWLIAGAVALLTGFSKTGIVGLGTLSVVLLTLAMPSKVSVGVMLPMLIVADVFAVLFYRRHAVWRHLWRLYPWVAAGLVPGYVAYALMPSDVRFGQVMGAMILVVLALLTVREVRGPTFLEGVPQRWWFAASAGFLGGFFTAFSNAAGPIFIAYVIAMGLDKHEFMGTSAWYFLTVNVVKLPALLAMPVLGAGAGVTGETLLVNLKLVPLIVLGALAGPFVFKRVPQRVFEWAVLVLAAAGAGKLVFGPYIGL
jgi:uncharacterized membrane protein YfcA